MQAERLVDGADYDEDEESGFLKLKPTQEWIVGESDSAPMNRKALAKVFLAVFVSHSFLITTVFYVFFIYSLHNPFG